MSRRRRLAGATYPADIFRDLDALRQGRAPGRRPRAKETFAMIPHDRAMALCPRLSGAAWLLLIELDRAHLKGRCRNPIQLPGARLKAAGLSRHSRQRALRRLEAAGVIRIEQRGRGRNPWVEHLWYERQD